MKAFLKEKRIGLRSLWRRGLVILSLFALVLASCDDTSGGGSPAPNGRVPLEIRVKTQPTTVQNYEGLPVTIEGIEIEGRYGGANPFEWVPVTDLSSYKVSPKYTQRKTSDEGKDGVVYGAYTLYGIGAEGLVTATINIKVTNLVRSDNTTLNESDNLSDDDKYKPNTPTGAANGPLGEFWGDGLNVVAIPGTYKDKYYVDDFPDFDGIKVYAQYRNGGYKEIPLTQDLRWEIKPSYENARKGTPTGPGVLAITIGGSGYELWTGTIVGGSYGPSNEIKATEGVTKWVNLSEVYHVTDVALEKEPVFDGNGIFYWEDDNSYKWLSENGLSGRVKDEAMIKICGYSV